jgi:hypothetical protein
MKHELDKLDVFLNIPIGTSKGVLIGHLDPRIINEKLSAYHIILDSYGMVPKGQRNNWKLLMQFAGISRKYWKDPDELFLEKKIDDL